MNIKGIAEIAGVSVSTVSRVLNDSSEVKDITREKIMEIMKEQKYVPNNSARNLKRIDSKSIGVLVDGGYNPFFYEVINIISKDIKEKGYSMVVQYRSRKDKELLTAREFIKEKKLSGLICIGINFLDVDIERSHISDIEVPIVSISAFISKEISKYISSVNIDDFKAAYSATNVLINNGHSEIGIITSDKENDFCGRTRLQAYEKALCDNNLKVKKAYIEFGDYTFETGYKAMERMIKKKKVPTAIFIISDIMAIGAAKACANFGIRVPEDISIIGFDGIEHTKYFHPSLTTVKQPYEYMAAESVSLLMELINDKAKHQHINFDVKIIERDSVKALTV